MCVLFFLFLLYQLLFLYTNLSVSFFVPAFFVLMMTFVSLWHTNQSTVFCNSMYINSLYIVNEYGLSIFITHIWYQNNSGFMQVRQIVCGIIAFGTYQSHKQNYYLLFSFLFRFYSSTLYFLWKVRRRGIDNKWRYHHDKLSDSQYWKKHTFFDN